MASDIILRPVTPADGGALLDIYAPYVRETAVTFEYEVPTPEEFSGRIAKTMQRYPYLAAQREGVLLGYAYAGPLHPRAAYAWSAESTVYIRQDARGQGIGGLLYDKLEELLRRQNIVNLNACIAYPNPPSVAFHEKRGFHTVGHFSRCAYKLGRWYDMVWMEKFLGEHPEPPRPFIPFPELRSGF